jgi:hypothetical protein
LLLGPGVANVEDALIIGKGFDVAGLGNVGKLHQPQHDYEAFSPFHGNTRSSRETFPKSAVRSNNYYEPGPEKITRWHK